MDLLLGDPAKARKQLGWEPKVTFKGLANMMVKSDWELAKRERVIAEATGKKVGAKR